jgi:DNA processing protein
MGPPPSEREAWALLLSVEGLGPVAIAALLGAYGSGRGILASAPRRGAAGAFAAIVAAAQGRRTADAAVGERLVALAADPGSALETLRGSGLRIVTTDDDEYPQRLRWIDAPPPVLLVRGDLAALSAASAIAVVGTRRASERGRLMAARIAAALSSAGAVVVSGLAVGIDGAAHHAVATAGRPTVAVLGSGHQRLFPRRHVGLAESILESGGAIVSERFPDQDARTWTFPQRNRLISGLADATIVVEAGSRSGALITADRALAQGRRCFVVPGPVDDARSAGCLEWYREWSELVEIVTGIPELVTDLGLDAGAGSAPRRRRRPSVAAELIELGPTAREVATALAGGFTTVDELAAETGHEAATILGAITLLEMRGLATSTFGRYRAAGRLASASPARVRAECRPGSRGARTAGAR